MAAKKPFRVQRSKSKTKGTVPLRQSAIVGAREAPTERTTAKCSPTADAQRLKQTYIWEYRNAQQVQTEEPSDYTPSPDFDSKSTWRREAEKLRKLGIDPGLYVRTLFKELRNGGFFGDVGVAVPRKRKEQAEKDVVVAVAKSKGPIKTESAGKPPTPAQLTSPKYLKMYQRTIDRSVADAELEWSLQHRYAKVEMSYQHDDDADDWDDAIIATLLADDSELKPLFCYCAAMAQVVVPEKAPEQKRRNNRFRRIADLNFEEACLQYCHNEAGYSRAWANYLPPTLIREAMSVYEAQVAKIKC
jgi:hypothetical protein